MQRKKNRTSVQIFKDMKAESVRLMSIYGLKDLYGNDALKELSMIVLCGYKPSKINNIGPDAFNGKIPIEMKAHYIKPNASENKKLKQGMYGFRYTPKEMSIQSSKNWELTNYTITENVTNDGLKLRYKILSSINVNGYELLKKVLEPAFKKRTQYIDNLTDAYLIEIQNAIDTNESQSYIDDIPVPKDTKSSTSLSFKREDVIGKHKNGVLQSKAVVVEHIDDLVNPDIKRNIIDNTIIHPKYRSETVITEKNIAIHEKIFGKLFDYISEYYVVTGINLLLNPTKFWEQEVAIQNSMDVCKSKHGNDLTKLTTINGKVYTTYHEVKCTQNNDNGDTSAFAFEPKKNNAEFYGRLTTIECAVKNKHTMGVYNNISVDPYIIWNRLEEGLKNREKRRKKNGEVQSSYCLRISPNKLREEVQTYLTLPASTRQKNTQTMINKGIERAEAITK